MSNNLLLPPLIVGAAYVLDAVQVSRDLTVDYYVHRTENAFIYWSQLALQLTLGCATGAALITLGRRAAAA